MDWKNFSVAAVFLILFCSCSVYQSEGRKFLEKNALEFSNQAGAGLAWQFKARQIQEPCAELLEKPQLKKEEFSLLESLEQGKYQIYQSEIHNDFQILVSSSQQGRQFLCAFNYENLGERLSRLDQDLWLSQETISQLSSIE